MNAPVHPSAPSGPALLDRWDPQHAFFLSSPGRSLLIPRWSARISHGSQPLQDRVRLALDQAHRAAPDGAALVAGAIPFDVDQPAHLGVAQHVLDQSPRGGAAPAAGTAPACQTTDAARAVPLPGQYCRAVARASEQIRHGDLDKVVLARTLELVSTQPIDLKGVLQRLATCHPNDYIFAIPLESQRMLLGASPELLVSRHGGVIHANPLAGSIPRSPDPAEDQRRAQALLVSAKDLQEHRVVVEAVRDSLAPLCTTLNIPDRPTLRQTPTLWHLSTPITGTSRADALSLALALHPTPAVCGMPVRKAQRVIAQSEPFERDYYAGMLGWMNHEGDGDWIVTLRCAEVAGRCIRLYAGAGIVGDSVPEAELAETATKFKSMLLGLGLEADGVTAAPVTAA